MKSTIHQKSPIGVFDSGYGGLTILEKIRELLPEYDFIYLGDNARAPYGTRSFDVVYQFTHQAVTKLFDEGCPLVILACNTASAKALRTIQQQDLPLLKPGLRVLGMIHPTVEMIDSISKTKHVGVLGTSGTISSASYSIEIHKLFPDIKVTELACPMWVPLVENHEFDTPGADYFVKKYLDQVLTSDPAIDTIVLGCTHYPFLMDKIKQYLPKGITVFSQGACVANSLKDYLFRHPEMDKQLSKGGECRFLTTESAEAFERSMLLFFNNQVAVEQIILV